MTAQEIAQVAAAFVGGSGIAAVFAKRVMKSLVVTGAEIDIIEQLRTEVRRLTEQNNKLAETLTDLQIELGNVRAENAELRILITNQKVDHA